MRAHVATAVVALGWTAHAAGWLAAVVRRRGGIAYPNEWNRELLLRLAMVLLIARAVVSPRATLDTWASIVGLVVFWLGTALAIVARWRMGASWGIGVRPHTQPNDAAIFRALRHPIYIGTTVAIVGQCLALRNIASFALLVGAVVVIPIKISREREWLRRST